MLAATSITRVHQMHGRDRRCSLRSVSTSRFEVLALLTFSRAGELPMGKIGDRLQVHAASVTNTIQRLERLGFVRRVPHPADGRTTLARILDPGRHAARRGAHALAAIEFGLDGLDSPGRSRLFDTLVGFRRANGDFG
ncbi:MAG: MarR family transcriptional regulator [Acidimicrobiales bacterium]